MDDMTRAQTGSMVALAVLAPLSTLAAAYATLSEQAYSLVGASVPGLIALSLLAGAIPLGGAIVLRRMGAPAFLRLGLAFAYLLLLVAALFVVLVLTGIQLVPLVLTLFVSLWVLCWPSRRPKGQPAGWPEGEDRA